MRESLRPKIRTTENPIGEVKRESGRETAPTQEQVDQTVLMLAKRMQSGAANSFDILDYLPRNVSTKADEENEWTRAYRAFFNVAREHPEYAQELGEMQGMIDQNPQMLHPAHHLDIASEVMWDPRIHSFQKGNLLHGLGYALRFMESPQYEAVIKRKLDFTNPAHFTETSHFLEFMQQLYNIGGDYSYGDNVVISRVQSALRDAMQEKKGSYLLNMRAKQLLDSMKDAEQDDFLWSDSDRIPFEITLGRFGYPHEDGLYLAGADESPQVRASIEHLHSVENEIRTLMARGRTSFRKNDPLMEARSDAYESFFALTSHKIGPEDVALPTDPTAAEAELHDYTYLLSRPLRQVVRDDFGAEVTHLSIREQFKFLNFLKTVDLADAEKVQEFTKTFGDNGLRTFLVTADDAKLREAVFAIGRELPKEDAQQVFDAYGKLVSGIDSVGDYLREQFKSENTTAAQKIVERMLDRARNLLRNAHEYRNDPEELVALVASVDADTHLFTDACRTLKQYGKLSIEEIAGSQFESAFGDDISAVDKEVMLTIQARQYANKYSEQARMELRSSLGSSLSNPSTKFYLYRKDGEIVTYVRFDESAANDEASKHMGSFMTNPKFEGGALGQAMLEVSLREEVKGGVAIKAECDPSLVPFYQRFGFAPVGGEYIDELGIPTYNIVLESAVGAASLPKAA